MLPDIGLLPSPTALVVIGTELMLCWKADKGVSGWVGAVRTPQIWLNLNSQWIDGSFQFRW